MDSSLMRKAKMLLDNTENTCVFCGQQAVFADRRRGVRPLLDLLESGADVAGFAVADKVVGKAAAYLYCLLNVGCLYARVISQPALSVLQERGIPAEYSQIVPAIQNRTKDGLCPTESAVMEIDDPSEAYHIILKTLVELGT